MQRLPKLIDVGVITSAHGIRGQVSIHTFLDNPKKLEALSPITSADGKTQFDISIEGQKNKLLIASIKGITDRNAAEKLKGTVLCTPATSLPKKEDNTWHYSELTGLSAKLENGRNYGKIVGVYNFGAGDIIEIEKLDATTEMLPFNNKFVGTVDTDKGYVLVTPPDYIVSEDKDG